MKEKCLEEKNEGFEIRLIELEKRVQGLPQEINIVNNNPLISIEEENVPKEKSSFWHSLKIIKKDGLFKGVYGVYLDGKKVKGVQSFELKGSSCPEDLTELTLKMVIKDHEVEI